MKKQRFRLSAVFGAVLLVAAACSSGGADDSTDASSSGNGDAVEVIVTLNEFDIEMSQTEFEAGVDYVFTVTNSGVVAHEMMLVQPFAPGEAPGMEELDEMAVAVFSADDLGPGATVTQTVSYPTPGPEGLEAACYVPGHYEAGMKLPITVTG